MARADLRSAIHAIMALEPADSFIDAIMKQFATDNHVPYVEFRKLVTGGMLYPEHVGRHYVVLSLAEAETIRRILHVRKEKYPTVIPGANTEVALRYSPKATIGAPPAGDGGFILDASPQWMSKGTGATAYEAAVAHSCFRFFDCDMFFPNSALDVLVRTLQGSVRDRERFFQAAAACRRRMDRKWKDTPLAKVFLVPDEWQALKQKAQAVYVIEAIKAKGLTLWEAFTAFDGTDNNGILSPAEFYGALMWLGVPGLTAEDVVDFIEAALHGLPSSPSL
jgi:hypothetical protein